LIKILCGSNFRFLTQFSDYHYQQNALESRLAALEKGKGNPQPMRGASGNAAKKIWDQSKPITVQGGSLKTWSFASPLVERVQVVLKTEGRPLDANVELWQGPDNTPHKMRVYVENGEKRPFAAVVETPSCPNTISLRNTGQLEFPFYAYVSGDTGNNGPDAFAHARSTITTAPRTIQGGALRTYPFEPNVDSVKVLLTTDGRPLNARIELLQGPNNNKQVVELYTEDGNERPFFAIIETPGSGNVVRIVNTATVEFPLTCSCEPHMVGTSSSGAEPVIGGDPTSGDFQVDQW
jgi:hypothetical protein